MLICTLIDVQPVSNDDLYFPYGRNLLLLPASSSILVSINRPILELLVEATDFSLGYEAEA
jgi:hypothetical protein